MESLAANEQLDKAGPTGPAAGHLACALRAEERLRLREGASARTRGPVVRRCGSSAGETPAPPPALAQRLQSQSEPGDAGVARRRPCPRAHTQLAIELEDVCARETGAAAMRLHRGRAAACRQRAMTATPGVNST